MNREKLTLFLISEGIYVAVVGVMLWFMFPSLQIATKAWLGRQAFHFQLGRALRTMPAWQREAWQVRGKLPAGKPKADPHVPPAFQTAGG